MTGFKGCVEMAEFELRWDVRRPGTFDSIAKNNNEVSKEAGVQMWSVPRDS